MYPVLLGLNIVRTRPFVQKMHCTALFRQERSHSPMPVLPARPDLHPVVVRVKNIGNRRVSTMFGSCRHRCFFSKMRTYMSLRIATGWYVDEIMGHGGIEFDANDHGPIW